MAKREARAARPPPPHAGWFRLGLVNDDLVPELAVVACPESEANRAAPGDLGH